MKIMMIAVFSPISTNNSQASGFEKNGCEVIRYNYRERGAALGFAGRDQEIVEICKREKPDLVFFSKCNQMNYQVLDECNKVSKTCLWYMDPMGNFNIELVEKIKRATFTCCALPEPMSEAKRHSENVFFVHEGFDQESNFFIPNIEYKHNVSFIGNLRGDRLRYYKNVKFTLIQDTFGRSHSQAVCESKINLNFTEGGTSDRTYKVLASKGFLLTQPWPTMESDFEDGVDLVTFRSVEELEKLIKYYLDHFYEALAIAERGYETVQKFSRVNFAKRIMGIANNLT